LLLPGASAACSDLLPLHAVLSADLLLQVPVLVLRVPGPLLVLLVSQLVRQQPPPTLRWCPEAAAGRPQEGRCRSL
jgi:hypothetical protein